MPVPSVYTTQFPTGGGPMGGSRSGGGSSTAPWYTDPYFWLNAGSTILDAGAGVYSAGQSNKTNVKLQREQRDWQKMMADSEIQRRKKDYELAGFNPALAAIQGGGASSPSVSAPQVEPTFRPGGLAGLSSAAQTAANIQNVRADTLNKTASARIQNVEANIREAGEKSETDLRVNRNIEEFEWNDLKTKILRSEDISSAAGAKVARDTADSLIQTARQQADAGKIDLDALKRIAEMGGVEATKMQWLISLIVRFMTKGN